jgi:hypothetical protein
MKKSKLSSIIFVLVGAFMIYWAETHSPKDVGQVIGNVVSGSYTMSETGYYISLVAGIAVAVYGVFTFVKSK